MTLHCAETIASAEETDLLENPIEGALGVKENEIELTIKPYEPTKKFCKETSPYVSIMKKKSNTVIMKA